MDRGELLAELDRPEETYYRFQRFSEDGKALILFGSSGTIRTWDIAQKRDRAVVPFRGRLHAVSTDGKRFLGSLDTTPITYYVGDTSTGKPTATLTLPPAKETRSRTDVFAPRWQEQGISADGRLVALTFGPDLVIARDSTGMGRFTFTTFKDRATWAVHFAGDNRTVFAGMGDGDIRRWDLSTGKEGPVLRGHRRMVTGIHTARGDGMLVSVSRDGTFRRWDLAAGKELALPEGYIGTVRMAVSADRRHVALGDAEGQLDVWDVRTAKRIRNLRAPGPAIHALAFAPDGKALATAEVDGAVRRWAPIRSGTARSGCTSTPRPTARNVAASTWSPSRPAIPPTT